MKKIFFLLIAILCLKSYPGGTSIGNGGGLGELQFIYYFDNTDQIIEICEKSITCTVPESWKVINTEPLVKIGFEPSVENNWHWTHDTLTVSQQWLYQGEHHLLRSDTEIMAFVIATQVSHHQNLEFSKSYEEALENLKGLSFYNQSVSSQMGSFKFHWITLTNQNNNLKLFALEDKIKSYSINDLILLKAATIDVNTLEVYNVFVVEFDTHVMVYGKISGKNGDTHFNQRHFKIKAQIDENKIIFNETIQLFLFIE